MLYYIYFFVSPFFGHIWYFLLWKYIKFSSSLETKNCVWLPFITSAEIIESASHRTDYLSIFISSVEMAKPKTRSMTELWLLWTPPGKGKGNEGCQWQCWEGYCPGWGIQFITHQGWRTKTTSSPAGAPTPKSHSKPLQGCPKKWKFWALYM